MTEINALKLVIRAQLKLKNSEGNQQFTTLDQDSRPSPLSLLGLTQLLPF